MFSRTHSRSLDSAVTFPVALAPTHPFVFATFPRRSPLWSLIAGCERILALFLLVLAAPALLIAGIAIAALSRRLPLITHPRVGRGGVRLGILKLRTMWGAESLAAIERRPPEPSSAGAPTTPKDPQDLRITSPLARFCRKYSIDELPQLWQVVRGDLALIGPRPLTMQELCTHYSREAAVVLGVKPGLTGLWQVRGRGRLSLAQRRRLDLFLVQRWSLRLYLFILIQTIPRVLLGRDAW